MMKEDMPKSSDSARLKSIEREIKTIGDRSTWLLGFLTIIVAGLTSFVFQDLNAIINENDFPFLKPATLGLLIHYLLTTLIVLFVQMVSFLVPDYKIKTLKNQIEVNTTRLKRIKRGYRIAMIFAISSLFAVCGFAVHFLYG